MYYALLRCDTTAIEDPKLIGLYRDIKQAEEKLYSVFGKFLIEYFATDPSMVNEIAYNGETKSDKEGNLIYLYDGVFEYYILPFEGENIYE